MATASTKERSLSAMHRTRFVLNKATQSKNGARNVTFLATLLILLFWWAAFFPGAANTDTPMHIDMVASGHWGETHAVPYTALFWVSLKLFNGVWFVSLTQVVAMAGGLACVTSGLQKLGVRAGYVISAAIICVAIPPLGFFINALGQDVLLSICCVYVLAVLLHIIASYTRGAEIKNYLLFWLGVGLCAIALSRPNGLMITAISGSCIVFALRHRWRSVLSAVGLSFVVATVVTFEAFPAMGVGKPPAWMTLSAEMSDISVVYADHPQAFTSHDLNLMRRISPLSDWARSGHLCPTVDYLYYFDGHFNAGVVNRNGSGLARLWLGLSRREPGAVIAARVCRGAIAWNPIAVPVSQGGAAPMDFVTKATRKTFDLNTPTIKQEGYTGVLVSHPLSEHLRKAAASAVAFADRDAFRWLLSRGATWCYLAYLAIFIYWRRTRLNGLLAAVAVSLGVQLTVAMITPSQVTRYMLPCVYLGIMLLPLAFTSGSVGRASDHASG